MIEKLIDEIFKKIVEYNTNINLESIPHSDIFEKLMTIELGIEKHELKRIINILKESHKILTFEITKEDKNKKIKNVEGYVEADIQTIRKMKNFFQALLMDEWETQYHTRLLFHNIVKEIYARPQNFKNTPIGQLANKAIMLDEYEGLIDKEYRQFTEEWKENKLKELISLYKEDKQKEKDQKTENDQEKIAEINKFSNTQRAVDSELYYDFTSAEARKTLNKMLQIYGVEFYFRVNLRKYNFELLKKIIESGEITRKKDLTLLKGMLKKVKGNTKRDIKLLEYTEDISKLERAISHRMLYSHADTEG